MSPSARGALTRAWRAASGVLLIALAAPAASAAAPAADLVVTGVTPQASVVEAGRTLPVHQTVLNQGASRAGGSTVTYLLSRDRRAGRGDARLQGHRRVGALRPGRRGTGVGRPAVPPATPAGRYVLFACADGGGRILEVQEANNCRAARSRIAVGAPRSQPVFTPGPIVAPDPGSSPAVGTPAAEPPPADPVPADTEPPLSEASAPDFTRAGTVSVSYRASDTGSGLAAVELWVQVPGSLDFVKADEQRPPGAARTFAYPAAAEGRLRFYTVGVDRAGNRENVPAHPDAATTIDRTAPSIDVSLTPAAADGENGIYRAAPSARARADDPSLDETTCTVDSAAPVSVPPTTPTRREGDVAVTGDGPHAVVCRASDRAGNGASAERRFAVDGTAPAVSITGPAAQSSTSRATTTVEGDAGEAEQDADEVTVEIRRGAELVASSPAGVTAGHWSWPSPRLTEGSYTATARQRDRAGNVAATEPLPFSVVPRTLLAAGDIASGYNDFDEATARLLDARPTGTVATLGDNAYDRGTASEFTNWYAPTWGRHRDRTRPSAGNHEYMTPGAAGYFDYFGAAAGQRDKGYYSYELGDWHIVVLNSNCADVGGCSATSPQAQWLRDDLAARSAGCTLAYWHHPLFSNAEGQKATSAVKPLWEVLYERGADVVLNGHAHNYERFPPLTPEGTVDEQRGLRQFVVGSGGKSHYHFLSSFSPPSVERDDETNGILEMKLFDGSYDWRFVPEAGGTYRDAGNGDCH